MPYPSLGTFPGLTTFPGLATSWAGATFEPPTDSRYVRLEPGTNLIGVFPYGLNVWRVGGVWHQGYMPSADEIAGADRFYGGGRIHSLSLEQYVELVAGGYGDYITLEVP